MNLDQSNAFMIRNDGEIFNVRTHPYGNEDIEYVEETLAAAEWLYKHTGKDSTKLLIVKFIKTWADSLDYINDKTAIDKIYHAIDERPYKFLSREFVKALETPISATKAYDDLETVNKLVCMELNQEFLRARYGGMYNTIQGSREMVFRVSSVGFNWFDIIWKFVEENKSRIDYVTVCADEESTRREAYYYNHNGTIFYRTPVDEFIMLSGNPIVEKVKKNPVYKIYLAEGKSLYDAFSSKNYGNIVFENQLRRDKEILKHYTQIMED